MAVSFTYKAPDAAPDDAHGRPGARCRSPTAQWYLQGWCHLRQAMRTFHLDRVSDLRRHRHPDRARRGPGAGWFDRATADDRRTHPVPRADRRRSSGDYLDRAAVETAEACSIATMRVADEHSLRRLAARRGGAWRSSSPKRRGMPLPSGRRQGSRSTGDVPCDGRRSDDGRRLAREATLGTTNRRGDDHVGNVSHGWHLLIILAVILLLFGAAKLPALAKSMGQSARVFKGEMKAMKDEDATATRQGRESARRPPATRSASVNQTAADACRAADPKP